MKLTATMGITAVDMVCTGGKVSLVLPTKKQLIEGDIEQALTAGDSELPLLLAACNARDLFMPMPWTSDAVERRGKCDNDNLVVSVMGSGADDGEELACLRRYTIARNLHAISSQELMANGQRYGSIEYLSHAPLQSWPQESLKMGAGVDGTMEFPRAIRISHSSKMTLELSLTNVSLNMKLASDCFELKKPENCKRREIVAVIRSGEKILAP